MLSIFIYLFIYFWLCWVFVSVRGLSLVVASGGHSSSRCAGLSLSQPLLLQGTGSRCAGSVVVAHGPSCSAACGIFPDQGSNPCPLHWQADSEPLRHQGSPLHLFICLFTICISSLMRCLFRSLAHFKIRLFISLLLSFKSSLYILDNSLLTDMSFANTFSQSVACLLIIATVSFKE